MSKKKIVKKPIYKHWTFWVMIVSILFNVILMRANLKKYNENIYLSKLISHQNEPVEKHKNIETTKETTSKSESKKYNKDEEAVVLSDNSEKKYSLKILSAKTNLTDQEKNLVKDKQNVVAITYEYKNYNLDKPLIISSQFMNAYINGKALENMSYMIGQTKVSKGKSAETTILFSSENPLNDIKGIEVEYINDFSVGFEGNIIFDVPITN